VSSLEQIAVGPSHYEVTVVTITCGISICKNKFGIWIGFRFEEELIENGQESNRVRFWAHTEIIIPDRRVRHMTFVIRRIKVYSIPARGEIYLRPQNFALVRRKPVESSPVTEASKGNGSLSVIAVVVSASQSVTRNHPESIRKSQRRNAMIARPQTGRVIASPYLIVHRRTVPYNQLVLLVGHLMVHVRHPIIAVIDGLVAGGEIGNLVGIEGSHETLKGIATDDAVNVTTGCAGSDDGVRALNGERVAVHGEGVPDARDAREEESAP